MREDRSRFDDTEDSMKFDHFPVKEDTEEISDFGTIEVSEDVNKMLGKMRR